MLRCPYCLHYIKSHDILDTHAIIFHGVKLCSRDRTDVKRLTVYPCELCKACIFSSVHSYSQHLKQVHSKPLFSCDQCDKSYFSKGHLKKHTRTKHGGHKDYFCKYCYKEYNDRVRVVEHMTKDHPGNEPYLEPGKNFGKQDTSLDMGQIYKPLDNTPVIKEEPTGTMFHDPSPDVPYPTVTPSCHDLSLKPTVTPSKELSLPTVTLLSRPTVTPCHESLLPTVIPLIQGPAQPSATLLSQPSVTPLIMDPSY